MKKLIIATALAGFAVAPMALAGDKSFADIDTNGDAMLSLAELQAVKPEMTEAKMAKYDTDGDAMISEAEFDAWKAKAEESKDADKPAYGS